MLTSDEIRQAAERLDIAERTREQTELLSLKYPRMTMDDAYGVQAAWVKRKVAVGRKVIGVRDGYDPAGRVLPHPQQPLTPQPPEKAG